MASRLSSSEQITEAILSELDSGTVPWTKPWVVNEFGIVSHATGKAYSLRNRMLLKYGGEYATFNQIRNAGGHVRKGEKSSRVFFGKVVEELDEYDEAINRHYILACYPVFRIGSQTEGIEPKYRSKWERGGMPKSEPEVMACLLEYFTRSGVKFLGAGDEAFYSPSDDTLQVPGADAFANRSQYWHTVFHEVVHSTGAPSRLARTKGKRFGDSAYATEELVADIGACLCLGRLGLPTEDCIPNSSAYIKAWSERLRTDCKSAISQAARLAEQAVKYIFNTEVSDEPED